MDGPYVFIFLPLAFCFMQLFIKALRNEDQDKTPATLASICFALMMLFFALLIAPLTPEEAMYEILFIDLDDTILDFKKAEKIAIGKTLVEFGLEPTEEVLHRYHLINKAHWERLERGEITREQVLVGRFGVLFSECGIDVDPTACARCYEKNLSQGHFFLPGAEEALENLSRHYRLFLASNGTASVQHGRMKSADLYRFFEEIFISQEVGFNKPAKAYFDACFARIRNFDPARALMVGDSLTSDILGGINAGLATVWVNPEHKPAGEIQPDYEIESLSQLEELLERLK